MNGRKLGRIISVLILLVIVIGGVAYLYLANAAGANGPLRASGTVEGTQVVVGPEMAGRVAEVLVEEGDAVEVDQPLFRMDEALLQAQRRRVEAALEAARAAEHTARLALESARLQHELALQQARALERPQRQQVWRVIEPSAFDLPVWYYQQQEQIDSAQQELDAARAALEREQRALQALLDDPQHARWREAEQRLARAREAFILADEILDRARRARDNAELRDYAQELYDAAKAELDAAQSAYEEMLSTQEAQDLVEARARLAVAQARHDEALDRLDQLRTGEHSLQVQIAQAALEQAGAALNQARAAVAQAQAELEAIDLQLDRLVVRAPMAGVVLTRSVDPGEVLQPGSSAIALVRLDDLRITVYLPQDRYGQVALGRHVQVSVDSYPGVTFDAVVVRIADRAEFTPRNVQTEEGRRTMVFAVELAVSDPLGRLKPGMPADVDFGELGD